MKIYAIWAQSYDLSGKNGAIGYEGKMPWHIKEDFAYFKALTTGKTINAAFEKSPTLSNTEMKNAIIMGRKTWESLPNKPLENRLNIIVSHGSAPKNSKSELGNSAKFKTSSDNSIMQFTNETADKILCKSILDPVWVESIEHVLAVIKDSGFNEVWIIGGASIYEQFLPFCDALYITQIDAQFKADTYAPVISAEKWSLNKQSEWLISQKSKPASLKYRFEVYLPKY